MLSFKNEPPQRTTKDQMDRQCGKGFEIRKNYKLSDYPK